MKLIIQDFNIVNQKGFSIKDIKKHIEYCARISYKSQDRITDDSYEKFVNMLESRGHDRPLEFGTVHLKMPWKTFNNFAGFCVSKGFWDSCWIKYNIDRESEDKMVYITTNYRYYKKLGTLKPLYGYIDIEEFFTEEDNKFYPKRYTVHFITSRGIMDEFRTHVGLSHLAESSRYCSYDKNRFGNELTFIIPNWANTNCPNKEQERPSVASIEWFTAMLNAEASYMNLIKMGCTAQEAREVLPLAVKSELISCGFEDAWSNFFYRRCAKDAHPMAIEIATKVRDKFKELNYVNQ